MLINLKQKYLIYFIFTLNQFPTLQFFSWIGQTETRQHHINAFSINPCPVFLMYIPSESKEKGSLVRPYFEATFNKINFPELLPKEKTDRDSFNNPVSK